MEIVGTIKKISPVQQISPTFSKRECVILTDEMYPQTIMVEFAQSRAALLDGFIGRPVRPRVDQPAWPRMDGPYRRGKVFHFRRRLAY